jgi:hypothetical protein
MEAPMNETISLEELKEKKVEVLMALYQAAKPIDDAVVQQIPNEAKKKAEDLISEGVFNFSIVSFFNGGYKILHLDLSGDEFDPKEYDKANGSGLAERTIADLRTKFHSRASLTGSLTISSHNRDSSVGSLPGSPLGSPFGSPLGSAPSTPTLDRPVSLELPPPPPQHAPVPVAQHAPQPAPQHAPQHTEMSSLFRNIFHPAVPPRYR